MVVGWPRGVLNQRRYILRRVSTKIIACFENIQSSHSVGSANYRPMPTPLGCQPMYLKHLQSCAPNTMIIATRYGRGRNRLKVSTSGSTAGSPSMPLNHKHLHTLPTMREPQKYLSRALTDCNVGMDSVPRSEHRCRHQRQECRKDRIYGARGGISRSLRSSSRLGSLPHLNI